jgi:hypothetical protein
MNVMFIDGFDTVFIGIAIMATIIIIILDSKE